MSMERSIIGRGLVGLFEHMTSGLISVIEVLCLPQFRSELGIYTPGLCLSWV
jgi:hypothetical protein